MLKTALKLVIFSLATMALATRARADDWTLNCNYPGGVALAIKYDAGGPAHSVSLKSKGSTNLKTTPAVPAARLTAEGLYTFIVDRERTGAANEHSLVIRVNTETLESILEAGNGVSWDYLTLKGVCAAEE